MLLSQKAKQQTLSSWLKVTPPTTLHQSPTSTGKRKREDDHKKTGKNSKKVKL